MKIAIIHLGNLTDLIPATSIVKYIKKCNVESEITFVVSSKDFSSIFKYNKNIDKILSFEEFKRLDDTYDLLINLFPYFPENLCKNVVVKNVLGFNYNEELDKYKTIFSLKENTNEFLSMNIFQLYFKLIGVNWEGEGYDICYYPQSKLKRNKIGISVANANLRNYILDELKLDNSKMWYIPYKKNVFKRMDEINKCKEIITDDLFVFHLAMALKKYVYFLQTFPLNLKLELFKKGKIFNVSLANII